jgi:hypothetical protein
VDSSRIVAWTTLASAFVAAGMLLRSRIRPDFDDPREQVIYDMSTAIALSAMVGSLPRLFHVESDVLHYAADSVSIAVSIFVFVQLRQLLRMKSGT